jgi:hypothetical protein
VVVEEVLVTLPHKPHLLVAQAVPVLLLFARSLPVQQQVSVLLVEQ